MMEERAALEQMLKEKGEFREYKVARAMKEKAPWRESERRAVAEGQFRTKKVQQQITAQKILRKRRRPLTPEQEATRAKNMAEVEAKLEKTRERFRRIRARKRAEAGGEGFIPEKRLNPPPEYED
jgi:hypothetical protein